MNIEKIALKYFEYFSNKDINSLGNLLADDIYLRDWEVESIGINNVLKTIKEIVNKLKSIRVEILNILIVDLTIVCELKITIDYSIILLVVDILEFDKSGKIKSIRAYKGN